ncbi:MAG: carboxymuconolactone decarboxylase family protein [Vicinamibacterales bacterium]
MFWIETVAPADAVGDLAAVYARIADARGGVAAIHQAQSLNPRALAAHFDLYKAILFQTSSLSRAHREAIGVIVSRANACEYCVAHHQAALDRLPPGPPLHPRVAEWVERLARQPESASPSAVEALRGAGLDDRAILDAVLTVSYFSFVNRVVLALGVPLETGYEATCRPD